MATKALYFPHIAIPNSAWTTQAILYWDQVASIVPIDFMHDPEPLDGFMRELLAEGLIEPILPGQHLHTIGRFDACFMEYVNARVLPQRIRYQAAMEKKQTTLIHAEKLGSIPDFLVDQGLAKRVSWDWFELPKPLANQFMAYLATSLGAVPEVDATPITDQLVYATMLGRPGATISKSRLHAQKARKVILNSLLPIPNHPIDVGRLLKFKQAHGHMLPALREKVEAHCALIATVPDAEQRLTLTENFLHECSLEVAEIEAAMKPTFGQVTFASLVPLFGSGLTLRTTDTGNELAYAGAALSFVGAAYAAIASIRGNRQHAEARPLAYIARARHFLPASENKA